MLQISSYQSRSELARIHPEIKSLRVVYQVANGETVEMQLSALRERHIQGILYLIGNSYFQAVDNQMPRLCACYSYVGDNDDCPVHGGR